MSQHRFTITVDIPDDAEARDAENWDRDDLTFALTDGRVTILEVEEHEVFEE